jgi:hypothetical protein
MPMDILDKWDILTIAESLSEESVLTEAVNKFCELNIWDYLKMSGPFGITIS